MSIWKRLTSTFYATGGAMGLKSDVIDEAVQEGARAKYDLDAVVIQYPDGRETYHKTSLGRRAKAVKFVNEFNEKAAAASK